MAGVSSMAVEALKGVLLGETGLSAAIAGAIASGEAIGPVTDSQISVQNVSMEIAERGPLRYPQFCVYCEKLVNNLREKFRNFSGKARLATEVRVSQERVDGLEALLHRYISAVLSVLDTHRGDWGMGLFYGGGYEVVFSPVKAGGKNYVQVARVYIDIDVSV
ncbi:MAG: hypothetical protein HY235_01165 [Acidobacteria bacterium]|nr:hypothetical protein [Acidobacteriota bacterium]